MLLSMTGFGKAESIVSEKKITLEIKSLNSKFLDLNLKIPSMYRELELPIRTLLAKKVIRGKVEVFVHYEQLKQSKNIHLNENLIVEYYSRIKAINEKVDPENKSPANILEQVLRLPDVVMPKIKEKLSNAANELLLNDKLNNDRLEQELIYYAEKLDITEEKVRLKEHCKHFLKTASENTSNGKKLGFITQEMGREINTLGSKAHHLEIQKIVVLMKDHLEKIKEQVLNVL